MNATWYDPGVYPVKSSITPSTGYCLARYTSPFLPTIVRSTDLGTPSTTYNASL